MTDIKEDSLSSEELLRMTAQIVAAYVKNNELGSAELPEVIKIVHSSLEEAHSGGAQPVDVQQKPAISVRRSVTDDYIICLEDGKKLKMLKRYLRSNFNLSPEEYRAKWNLPPDYPMVAPNYAKQRSDFAKKIGLGLKKPKAPARRPRKKRE
ncbi:MucR family transcriptional regulator [Oceanibacterium hippocampi]|uniref:Transcriptional regulatory protein MucR n=1 Tax=Oceanibacterium hippocampi TaxID=745714 RepID=A0A1Y5SNL4_9PROT|nr:MucR family transcriptional regulator [Oceanibacterium hippocampi]SLN44841.1 Transcriptional regulatory protein MucR [Oceanibacterium hippocampi]